jgi:hypothetical protein
MFVFFYRAHQNTVRFRFANVYMFYVDLVDIALFCVAEKYKNLFFFLYALFILDQMGTKWKNYAIMSGAAWRGESRRGGIFENGRKDQKNVLKCIFSENRSKFEDDFLTKLEKAVTKFIKVGRGTLPQPPPVAPRLNDVFGFNLNLKGKKMHSISSWNGDIAGLYNYIILHISFFMGCRYCGSLQFLWCYFLHERGIYDDIILKNRNTGRVRSEDTPIKMYIFRHFVYFE